MHTEQEIKALLQKHKLLVIQTGAHSAGDAVKALVQALNELSKQKETKDGSEGKSNP